MNPIDQLKLRLSHIPGLAQLTASDVEALRRKFPGLPEEYTQFLRTIGFGNLEEIQLYSGPVSSTSIYRLSKDDLSKIILFGDDFQGYCFGFDTERDFAVVEIDPYGTSRRREDAEFIALIDSYFPA